MSKESVRYLLDKYRLHPDRGSSQNFLTSDSVLADILKAAHVQRSDTVLEIGPGIGTLTAALAALAGRVIAIEQDLRFTPVLATLAAVNTNVSVRYGDFLKIDFSDLGIGSEYKVVANIPYHITSKIIAKLISSPRAPACIVLMVQKEVAERIIANPGDHSKLSLSVQFYGKPEIIRVVSRADFVPSPVVDSAIMKITEVHPWQYAESEKRVWQLIAFGFSSKRKKLVNNLAAGLQREKADIAQVFVKNGLDAGLRAEDLKLEDWRLLARVL